jgi:hypothetical protein
MTHIEVCPGTESGATTTTTTVDALNYINGCRRRRAATYRVPPIDCGCADPWTCRCYDAPEPSERNADGYHAAALHLLAAGLLPAPNLGAMRTLWRRRDSEQRELARHIAERWDVAA